MLVTTKFLTMLSSKYNACSGCCKYKNEKSHSFLILVINFCAIPFCSSSHSLIWLSNIASISRTNFWSVCCVIQSLFKMIATQEIILVQFIRCFFVQIFSPAIDHPFSTSANKYDRSVYQG
jgi:hypothetical protein